MAVSKHKITKLANSLADAKSAQDRQQIIDTLVEIGSLAVPRLVELLQDGDYKVRMAVAGGLGEIGDDQSVEPLIHSLSDTSKNVQRVATEALSNIGEPAVSALLDALIGKDQLARKWAAEALGNIGDASV
ncbi:MAG: HEAT repeat domain-containing protein, partial [Armatimonadetes bacterium]|nr:HEAT repeat domain-containing protein [Armatimonadota bacterium]